MGNERKVNIKGQFENREHCFKNEIVEKYCCHTTSKDNIIISCKHNVITMLIQSKRWFYLLLHADIFHNNLIYSIFFRSKFEVERHSVVELN